MVLLLCIGCTRINNNNYDVIVNDVIKTIISKNGKFEGKVISSKFQGRDYLVRFTFKNIELLTYSSQKLTKDELIHFEVIKFHQLCI